jgi:hypothetical protein
MESVMFRLFGVLVLRPKGRSMMNEGKVAKSAQNKAIFMFEELEARA